MPNWKKVIVSGSEAHLTSVTSSNGVNLADDAFLNLGDGNDLQLYHDGDNSFIKDAGTGGLFYRGGTQTFQNAAGSKTMVVLNAANSVDLNFNDSTKFQTTNTGVSVTGEVTATGNVSSSLASTGSFGRGFIADSLNLTNNAELRLGPEPHHHALNYNNNGNLDITPRSGFDVDIIRGNLILTTGGIDIKDDMLIVSGTAGGRTTINNDVVTSGNVSGSSTSTGSFGAYGTNFIPVGDNALDLGSSGNEWKDLYVDGIAYLDSINMPHEGKIDFAGGDGIIEANGNNNQIYLERNASGGHVGIYTTNPQSTLEVNGSFHASGNISGSTVTTGSFGRVETDGDAEFGNNVTINGTNATIANATNPHLFLNDTNAGAAIFQQSGNDTRIGSDSNTQVLLVQNNATAVTIDTNKDAFFVGNISGSVIRASGDIIAFNSSDERLKDNVTYIHKPIEKINQIGGYEFDWNEKQQVYHGHDVGVLAQELEKVLPEAVKDRDSGYKGVQYDKIIPLLIEGIKEQTEHIKDLKERIEKLEKLNKLF